MLQLTRLGRLRWQGRDLRTHKPRLHQISDIEDPRSASAKPVLDGVGDCVHPSSVAILAQAVSAQVSSSERLQEVSSFSWLGDTSRKGRQEGSWSLLL